MIYQKVEALESLRHVAVVVLSCHKNKPVETFYENES